MKRKIAAAAIIALTLTLMTITPGPAAAQRKGSSATVQYGRVVGAQRTNLQSDAAKGALVGGALGLASASGKSSSKKWRNSLIGAAAGGGMTRAAEGSLEGMMYSVEVAEGTIIKVVTDQTEIQQGDCVVVEQSGKQSNVRRASPTMCEPATAPIIQEPDVQEELLEEAEECAAAKSEVLAAETDEEMDRAVRKMKILCDD